MSISTEEVKKLAHLARIKIEEGEIEAYQEKINSILDYISQLQEVDTSNVAEFAHPAEVTNAFREDEERACSPETRKRLVEAFPNREGDLLKVQAVFEDRTE